MQLYQESVRRQPGTFLKLNVRNWKPTKALSESKEKEGRYWTGAPGSKERGRLTKMPILFTLIYRESSFPIQQ